MRIYRSDGWEKSREYPYIFIVSPNQLYLILEVDNVEDGDIFMTVYSLESSKKLKIKGKTKNII